MICINFCLMKVDLKFCSFMKKLRMTCFFYVLTLNLLCCGFRQLIGRSFVQNINRLSFRCWRPSPDFHRLLVDCKSRTGRLSTDIETDYRAIYRVCPFITLSYRFSKQVAIDTVHLSALIFLIVSEKSKMWKDLAFKNWTSYLPNETKSSQVFFIIYLLSACPRINTSGTCKTGIEYGYSCLSGMTCSPRMCNEVASGRFAWRNFCSLHSSVRHNEILMNDPRKWHRCDYLHRTFPSFAILLILLKTIQC